MDCLLTPRLLLLNLHTFTLRRPPHGGGVSSLESAITDETLSAKTSLLRLSKGSESPFLKLPLLLKKYLK